MTTWVEGAESLALHLALAGSALKHNFHILFPGTKRPKVYQSSKSADLALGLYRLQFVYLDYKKKLSIIFTRYETQKRDQAQLCASDYCLHVCRLDQWSSQFAQYPWHGQRWRAGKTGILEKKLLHLNQSSEFYSLPISAYWVFMKHNFSFFAAQSRPFLRVERVKPGWK